MDHFTQIGSILEYLKHVWVCQFTSKVRPILTRLAVQSWLTVLTQNTLIPNGLCFWLRKRQGGHLKKSQTLKIVKQNYIGNLIWQRNQFLSNNEFTLTRLIHTVYSAQIRLSTFFISITIVVLLISIIIASIGDLNGMIYTIMHCIHTYI